MSLLDAATGGTPGSGVKASLADAKAARELFLKSMGIADVNHVNLHPQPDGTFALHSKRNGDGAPTAIYDPKQNSLTVNAAGGTLSEDTRQMLQNIAVPPGRPGVKPRASEGLPVYFGNGRRKTAEEFGALSQAGQQAYETARTPEERAAALEKLGLSPAGIRQQMEAGQISFQQALALNGHFNHVLEHNATLGGAQMALNDWGLQPQNKEMGSWLHSGTPEQRAYAINQYFDQTSRRAENNLLTTPERMEQLRRRALGEIPGGNPEWGKPGAVSPGREPKDGPAGLLRIPLQGGGAAHIPTGTWTREDYETLDQHPDIRNLPHAEREAAVDTLLQDHYAQLSSQPGFSGEDHRKFRETAHQLRDRVAELKTLKDTAGEGVDMVKEAAKSEATTHVAAAADLSFLDGEGKPRWPAGNMAAQSGFDARNAKDTAQRLAQPTAEKKIDDALAAIHQDIRNGNFPLAPGEEQEKWIDALSAKFNPERKDWFDAVQGPADPTTPEGKKHLAHTQDYTLAHPENRAKILDYIRTGNEERWDELKHNLKKTPQRAQTEEERASSLKNDPIVRVLNNATGTDWSEDMKGANGAVAGHFVPGIGGASRSSSRASRWFRRGAGIAANIGGTVAQNTIENPDADFEDHKNAVIADYATSLGLKPLDHAKGMVGQKVTDTLQNRSGANNVSPGANYGPRGDADPPGGQSFEERHKIEQGGMQIPKQAAAQAPAAQPGIPVHTTETARAAREAWEKDGGKALQTIDRLKTKAKDAPLSAEEQHELDKAEKLQANVRVANLETEQQNRPQGLDPVKAQALETERAILQRPSSGEQPPGGGAGEPAAVPAGQDAYPPQPMNGGAGNGGKGGGESPPPPPQGPEQPSNGAGDGSPESTKKFTRPKPGTLDEAHEIDQAEKHDAGKLKADLEDQLRKNGKLTAQQAQELAKANAVLARDAPRDRGPLPPVPDARRTIQDLSDKATAGTLSADEAHQFAHAQRSIAQQRVNDLQAAEASGTLTAPQRRQLDRFRAILAASPYGTELPKGPPAGYDPHAPNAAHREWYPPEGDKAEHPVDHDFTPTALALSDEEIKTNTARLKASGHAHSRHGPEVTEGQLSDRAMYKVDPISQTKENGEHPGSNHKSSRTASQFTSDRAMTQAVKSVESSAEYRAARANAEAIGKDDFVVENISLESIFGPNYLSHVKGRTREGPFTLPTGVHSTNFRDGTIFVVFRKDPTTGKFEPHTMYAKPSLTHEPD